MQIQRLTSPSSGSGLRTTCLPHQYGTRLLEMLRDPTGSPVGIFSSRKYACQRHRRAGSGHQAEKLAFRGELHPQAVCNHQASSNDGGAGHITWPHQPPHSFSHRATRPCGQIYDQRHKHSHAMDHDVAWTRHEHPIRQHNPRDNAPEHNFLHHSYDALPEQGDTWLFQRVCHHSTLRCGHGGFLGEGR